MTPPQPEAVAGWVPARAGDAARRGQGRREPRACGAFAFLAPPAASEAVLPPRAAMANSFGVHRVTGASSIGNEASVRAAVAEFFVGLSH